MGQLMRGVCWKLVGITSNQCVISTKIMHSKQDSQDKKYEFQKMQWGEMNREQFNLAESLLKGEGWKWND